MTSELPDPEAAAALARIRIVLVDPIQPRNIGAAARAMKSMGLRRLALVRPQRFPHPEADVLAVSAVDILQNAAVFADLAPAIAGCHAVHALSARSRLLGPESCSVREMGPLALAQATIGDIAIVFGSEAAGLANADLALCQSRVEIPADPECRSLNLAAAVQVVCHELRQAALQSVAKIGRQGLSAEQLETLLGDIDRRLAAGAYYGNKNPHNAIDKLRRILQRAALDTAELHMLRGMLNRTP